MKAQSLSELGFKRILPKEWMRGSVAVKTAHPPHIYFVWSEEHGRKYVSTWDELLAELESLGIDTDTERNTYPRFCRDGGKCHHNCGANCWREKNTAALGQSGVWPEETQSSHTTVEGLLRHDPVSVAVCRGKMALFFDAMTSTWVVMNGHGEKRGKLYEGTSFDAALEVFINRRRPLGTLKGEAK